MKRWLDPEMYDVPKYFKQHAEQYERDTFVSASHHFEHPDYQAIIKMGMIVVPLLLKELQEEHSAWWFEALRQITGEDPTSGFSSRNYYSRARTAWLEWGKKKGYI